MSTQNVSRFNFWAFLLSICYALSLGFNYAMSNQNAYLPALLHQFDPVLLKNDWLITETFLPHFTFSILALPLYAVSPDGWGVAAANVVALLIASYVIFELVRALTPKQALVLPAFLLVILLVRTTETHSVSASYLWVRYFQPSTIGAIGYLLALLMFVRGRFMCSGAAIAASGFFHSNYLVLGIITFSFAHLLLDREKMLNRLASQLLLPALALLPFLPMLLTIATESAEFRALREMHLLVRVPHHHYPPAFVHEFVPFFGWVVLGLVGVLALAHRRDLPSQYVYLRAFLLSLVSFMGVGTLLTTVVYLPSVAQIQPWRVAPYLQLLAQVFYCLFLVDVIFSQKRVSKRTLGLIFIGIMLVAVDVLLWNGSKRVLVILAFISTPVVWATPFRQMTALVPMDMFDRRMVRCASAVCLIALAGVLAVRNSNLLKAPDDKAEMYAWIEANTDVDAIFITPPSIIDFCLRSQRATVVNWKVHPVVGPELAEWYQRLQAISGLEQIESGSALQSGYEQISEARLRLLVDTYAISYALVEKNKHRLMATKPVYEDDKYMIVEVQ